MTRFLLSLCLVTVAAGAVSADPQSDMAGWENALYRALMARTAYPSLYQALHLEGVAMVSFVVDRQGQVTGVRIVKSSGSVLLDGRSIRTVYAAQPLPAPPADVAGETFSFTVPMRYRLP